MRVSVYDFIVVRDGAEVPIPEIEVSMSHERDDYHLPAYWVRDEYTIMAADLARAIGGLSRAEERDLDDRAMDAVKAILGHAA